MQWLACMKDCYKFDGELATNGEHSVHLIQSICMPQTVLTDSLECIQDFIIISSAAVGTYG